ncbi:MAG: hypothetical protein AVDCRST_MAG67-981, partial [uncultured Solirubrobacteraceae bacterium]
AARKADRLSARAQVRHRRAEHGLDELRDVLVGTQVLRVPHRLRQPVRGDRRVLEAM